MQTLITIVHYIACILLILLVLLQSGKGSAAGIFGASGADNIFASIALTMASNKKATSSVMDRVQIPAAATAPATPATPAK